MAHMDTLTYYFLVFSAALVEGTILTMHGGLSPDLTSLEQVRWGVGSEMGARVGGAGGDRFMWCALVEGTIFTMHGGLSQDLTSLEEVRGEGCWRVGSTIYGKEGGGCQIYFDRSWEVGQDPAFMERRWWCVGGWLGGGGVKFT